VGGPKAIARLSEAPLGELERLVERVAAVIAYLVGRPVFRQSRRKKSLETPLR
jgi:hypothetical protein